MVGNIVMLGEVLSLLVQGLWQIYDLVLLTDF